MNEYFYTAIGKTVVLFGKYIFIPLLVSIAANAWVNKFHRPQPYRQKKKRSNKNRFKK